MKSACNMGGNNGVCMRSIYRTDDAHEQVELSVCLTPRGQWKLAAIEDFEKVCGDGGQPSNRPTSAPNGRHGTCLPSKRGPSCKKDEDCKGKARVVRGRGSALI